MSIKCLLEDVLTKEEHKYLWEVGSDVTQDTVRPGMLLATKHGQIRKVSHVGPPPIGKPHETYLHYEGGVHARIERSLRGRRDVTRVVADKHGKKVPDSVFPDWLQ